MATKTKINDYGDCIYSEDDLLELIYSNPSIDISKIYTTNDQYSKALQELDIDLPALSTLPERKLSLSEFDSKNSLARYWSSFE